MLKDFMFSKTLLNIEKSLDAYSMKHKTLTNNIANVNTPGYRAQNVNFESMLKNNLEHNHITKKIITNDDHITTNRAHDDENEQMITYKESTPNDTGKNNIDVDKEMAEMAENNLRYEMSVKLATRKYNGLRKAAKGMVGG